MSQLQHATSGASEAFSGAGSPPRVGSAEYASPRYLRRVECTPSGHEMSIDFDAEWESDVCAVCLTTVESLVRRPSPPVVKPITSSQALGDRTRSIFNCGK